LVYLCPEMGWCCRAGRREDWNVSDNECRLEKVSGLHFFLDKLFYIV